MRSAAWSGGAALLRPTAVVAPGLAVQGGVVQEGVYAVGNGAMRWCLSHPTGCAR